MKENVSVLLSMTFLSAASQEEFSFESLIENKFPDFEHWKNNFRLKHALPLAFSAASAVCMAASMQAFQKSH